MYVPPHFRNEDRGAHFDRVDAHPFATLFVEGEVGVEVGHVPLVLDRGRGEHGALRGHVAAANPIAELVGGAARALAIFQGFSAYVSPDWMAEPHQVPTWNYTVVHAEGRLRRLSDAELVGLLDALGERHEAQLAPKRPWTTDKLPADLFERQRRAIVGFDLSITTLTGKWKLSQNKTPEDRRAIAEALLALGGEANTGVARVMTDPGQRRQANTSSSA
jgi:transcriptional regulator